MNSSTCERGTFCRPGRQSQSHRRDACRRGSRDVSKTMNHEPVQERRDHVVRSMLPWRLDPLTECGCQISDVENVIALDELDDRIERDGLQPTASTVCVMCWQTSRQPARWETNPIGVIAREAVERIHGGTATWELRSPRMDSARRTNKRPGRGVSGAWGWWGYWSTGSLAPTSRGGIRRIPMGPAGRRGPG
jgi:hypothetical protein